MTMVLVWEGEGLSSSHQTKCLWLIICWEFTDLWSRGGDTDCFRGQVCLGCIRSSNIREEGLLAVQESLPQRSFLWPPCEMSWRVSYQITGFPTFSSILIDVSLHLCSQKVENP